MSSSTRSGAEEGRVVFGLDPSLTSFGVAKVRILGQDHLWSYGTEVLKTSRKGADRLEWFYVAINNLCAELPDLVVVEGYAFGAKAARERMGELGGVVRLALHQNEIPWVEVQPTALKKFVTGKGNAPKDHIMLEAYKRWKIDVPTTDEADAVGLALMGATACYGLDTELPKVNLEALSKVDWPGITG